MTTPSTEGNSPQNDLPLFGNLSSSLPPCSTPVFDRDAFRVAGREEREELVREATTTAVEQLSADLAAGRSESLEKLLRAMSHFHRYSFSNCLLILIQRPDATRVAGFRAWNKLNRFVRKGEVGIMVMAPVTKVVGEREELQDDGTTKKVHVRRLVAAKPVYVFDISQTDGEDLPELEARSGEPGKHLDKLKRLYSKHGISLEYVPGLPGGALGISEKGSVKIVEGQSSAGEFMVLVHELAHELLHQDKDRRKETTKTSRELEAEAVAYVVGHAIGLSIGKASSDYIQLYGGNPALLADSLDAIRSTADFILGAVVL